MNIKVDFDNIVVKEDKNDFNVKVLMLLIYLMEVISKDI